MRYTVAWLSGFILLFSIGLLVVLSRQHSSQVEGVGVSVYPIYDLVKQVAGPDVPVRLIAPAGASPHSFEPTATTVSEVTRDRLIFAVGHGLDDWVQSVAREATNRPVVNLDQKVSLLDGDPHYWLSPMNAQGMVQQIADQLSEQWPDKKTAFQKRATDYTAELDALITEQQANLNGRQLRIATFHNAFGYLARDFGVTVVTTFEEYAGQSPSPAWLADFEKSVKKNGLTVIYAEPDFPTSSLEPIAHDLGVKIEELDPLETDARHSDYLSALLDDLQTLSSHQ